ncbi:MAG TPA: PQQ-binding-like beta-propeller repeat protein [Vicinamibacterales bacterium]|nr:PQQ-binding-like beta-propeller repeat protein [Vicinamibacterales bacterium]
MNIKYVVLIGSVAFAAMSAVPVAQNQGPDWPQWRGPRRDGTLTSFVEPKVWPEMLTQRWKITVGEGYATPIFVGDRVYQFSRQGENEVMRAVDAATGKVVWEKRYAAPFEMTSGTRRHGPGPKSTPTYADGRVFTLGMSSIVTAWDAATGKELWRKPGGTVQPNFHTAMSPLVDRGLMILHVGGHNNGALTAFDPATGAEKWTWAGDGPAYGSPIILEIGGTRQVIVFSQRNLIGVNAANGQLLWSTPYESRSTTNSITPLVYGNTLIVSGQGKPLAAYAISNKGGQWAAEVAWENPQLGMSFSNAVLVGDAVFSMSPQNSGQFFWADAKTGKTLWTSDPRQAGNAAITRYGDLLFVLKEDGQLIVARANTARFEPLKTYTVATSATWAPPVISGNRIFVKDAETLALWTLN